MFPLKPAAVAVSLLLLTTACSEAPQNMTQQTGNTVENAVVSVADIQAESAKANELFEEIFMDGVMRSPMFQSYLGIKDDQDKWDDLSDAVAEEELEIAKEIGRASCRERV